MIDLFPKDPELQKIIALYTSNDLSNHALAYQLENSGVWDLSDFWTYLEALVKIEDIQQFNSHWAAKKPEEKRPYFLTRYRQYLYNAENGYTRSIKTEVSFHHLYFQDKDSWNKLPETAVFEHIRKVTFCFEIPLPLSEMGWIKAFSKVTFFRYKNLWLKPKRYANNYNGFERTHHPPAALHDWLGDTLAVMSDLRELHLTECHLENLPPALFELPYLELLNIRKNQLQYLPDDLAKLTRLRHLYISENAFTDWSQVFRVVSRLPDLRSFSWMSGYKQDVSHFEHCTRLHFNKEQWQQTGAWDRLYQLMACLPALTQLALHRSQLAEIPAALLHHIPHLQSLSLVNNQLTDLPAWITQWTQLWELNLSYNSLTAVPPVIRQLTQLRSLDLSHNPLTTLPDWLGELEQLQYLHLNHIQITQLPDSLRRLQRLQVLRVHGNTLTEIPEWLPQLQQLERLDWSDNELRQLPTAIQQLSHLHTLSLNHNPLQQLPENIAQMTQLRHISLAFMPEMDWTHTLGILRGLPTLETLLWLYGRNALVQTKHRDEQGNVTHITRTIPEDAEYSITFSRNGQYPLPGTWKQPLAHLATLRHLRSLTFRSLYGNIDFFDALSQVQQIEKLAFIYGSMDERQMACLSQLTRLKELTLERVNFYERMPSFIAHLSRLERLSLEGAHRVSVIPDFIGNLHQLRYLNFQGCSFKDIPASVVQLPLLEYLDCSVNSNFQQLPAALHEVDHPLVIRLSGHHRHRIKGWEAFNGHLYVRIEWC